MAGRREEGRREKEEGKKGRKLQGETLRVVESKRARLRDDSSRSACTSERRLRGSEQEDTMSECNPAERARRPSSCNRARV